MNIIGTQGEFIDKTRVEFQNLFFHPIGLRTYVQQIGRTGIVVDGFKNYRQLSLEEILAQVSAENRAFVGLDGKGAHAAFRIRDFELYKVAFDLPDATDYPIQMTTDSIQKLLKITDHKKFVEYLHELCVTDSEKFNLAVRLVNEFDLNSVPLQNIKAVEDWTGRKIID